MADLHPTAGVTSPHRTDPPQKTTAIYRKQPNTYGQVGLATSYTSNGETFLFTRKPSYYQLAAWDEARRKEPIIKQGLEYIVLALIAKIGAYSHPDSQIDDFVQANIENNIKRWISDLTHTLLWSGNSVSEINFNRKLGPKDIPQTWLDDLINYHPLQVTLHLNNFRVISDGDPVGSSPFKSGIYVPAPPAALVRPKKNFEYMGSLVRLPKSKRVYLTLGSEGNNPYGRSILESVLPYHLFKEAFRDMLTTALDRYGTPLVYAIVPPLDTKEQVQDPDGTVRPKTLQEMTVEQMQNIGNEAALVFTQISKEQPVQLGALTTGNNFSDAFNSAIELCDMNMLHGLGIPNLLIRDTSNRMGSSGASERQLELFDAFISSLFDLIVGGFLNQCIAQLIQYNFDPRKNPKAYKTGSIQKRPTRNTDLTVVVSAIESLTKLGYINPSNPEDFNYVRELVSLPPRQPDPLPDGVLPQNKIMRWTVADNADVPNPTGESSLPTADGQSQSNTPNPAASHVMQAAKESAKGPGKKSVKTLPDEEEYIVVKKHARKKTPKEESQDKKE